MRIGGIPIGIHQVPTAFIGPLAVHKELHVDRVAVADGNDRGGVKSTREGVESTECTHRQLQLVLRGAKVVAYPAISPAVGHVEGIRTGVGAGYGCRADWPYHIGQIIRGAGIIDVKLVGGPRCQARNDERIAGSLHHRACTLRKSTRTVLNKGASSRSRGPGYLHRGRAGYNGGQCYRVCTGKCVVNDHVINRDIYLVGITPVPVSKPSDTDAVSCIRSQRNNRLFPWIRGRRLLRARRRPKVGIGPAIHRNFYIQFLDLAPKHVVEEGELRIAQSIQINDGRLQPSRR